MPRFPATAAAIEHELEGFAEALLGSPSFAAKLGELLGVRDAPANGELDMATVKELRDALDATKASVDSLTAKVGAGNTGIDPADLDPIMSEITDLRGTVEALSKSLDKPAASTATGPGGPTAA